MGTDAVLTILQSWNRLFTPTEATSIVASAIMNNQSTSLCSYKHSCVDCRKTEMSYCFYRRSSAAVDFTRQENLNASVRALALQCAHEVRYNRFQMNSSYKYL